MVAVQHDQPPRNRIIAAARQLFTVQGFHQTPMSELASRAGVSVGLIYRLFKDKSDVIMAIVQDDCREKELDVEQILVAIRSGELSIEQGFTQLALDALSDRNEALSFEILAEAHRNKAVGDTIGEFCKFLRRAIREMASIANPALIDEGLEGAEEVLLGLMFGLGHRGLSQPRLPIKTTADQAAKMIVAAFTSVSQGAVAAM